MTKFVHTGDWQLGMTRHFLDTEAQARFSAARIDAIRSIGRLAINEGCSFVVVCGDVFETNHVARQVIVRALEAMAATPTVTFYLLPGNHDPLDASSVFRSSTFTDARPANVVVLDTPGACAVAPGLELVAAPWFSKRPLTDLVNAAIADLPADGVVRIAVGHGGLDTLAPDATDPALIRLRDLEQRLSEGRIHYVALGDRHSTTDAGTSGRVRYAGAPEPTDYTESDPGNVLLVELDANNVAVRPRRIGTWRFLRQAFDVTGNDDVDRVAAFLEAVPDKHEAIVKLSFVGQVSLAEKTALDAVLTHSGDLFAALETWERHNNLVVLPNDDDFSELDLGGFARDAVEELRASARDTTSEGATAQDALGLLFRLQTNVRRETSVQ